MVPKNCSPSSAAYNLTIMMRLLSFILIVVALCLVRRS